MSSLTRRMQRASKRPNVKANLGSMLGMTRQSAADLKARLAREARKPV